jgi:hypothetical protein
MVQYQILAKRISRERAEIKHGRLLCQVSNIYLDPDIVNISPFYIVFRSILSVKVGRSPMGLLSQGDHGRPLKFGAVSKETVGAAKIQSSCKQGGSATTSDFTSCCKVLRSRM